MARLGKLFGALGAAGKKLKLRISRRLGTDAAQQASKEAAERAAKEAAEKAAKEAAERAAKEAAEKAKKFVDDIVNNPKSVAGKSADDLAKQFNDAGYKATIEQSTKKGTSGKAVQVRIEGHPEITNIQVHPGGGRHTPEGTPYWKISTQTVGKTWVIPGNFRGANDLGGNVVRYDQ